VYFTPESSGNFDPGFRPGRFGPLLEVRLEDILVEAKHQAATGGAQGRVIIQSGHPLIAATTVNTLVFVDRHD
jgi:hypothetical protein